MDTFFEIMIILFICGLAGTLTYLFGKFIYDEVQEFNRDKAFREAEERRMQKEIAEREARKGFIKSYLHPELKKYNNVYRIYNYGKGIFTILNSEFPMLRREVLCILRENFDTNVKESNIISRNKNRCHSINWSNIMGTRTSIEEPFNDICHMICKYKDLCIDKEK